MDDEILNQQVRKFLKRVGVNSQQRIEEAVREASSVGSLEGIDHVTANVELTVPELGVRMTITDVIALE